MESPLPLTPPPPESQSSGPVANPGGSSTQSATQQSPFIAINIIGASALGLLALFVISQTIVPTSAGIAGLALVPMAALVIGGAAVYDVAYLSTYIFRHRHDGASKRRDWAIVGLCIALALLAAIGYVAYSDFSGLNYDKTVQHNQSVSQDQTLMNKATAAGYGFDLLTPKQLPSGYSLYMDQVTNDTNISDSIYLEEQYQTSSEAWFDLIEFSAAKRPYFSPPANCGYYLSPSDVQPGPAVDKVYPCTLVGQTTAGAKVYWYEIGDNGDTYDAYYVATGRDIVLMSDIKGTAPTRAQALSILSSLSPVSLSEVIKSNTAAGN